MNDTQIKEEDEIYCPECGKPIKRNVAICVNCGVQIKEIKTSETTTYNPNAKDKGIAIVLAIFLGFWSWLYTYKKDFKKFWIFISLIFVIVACVGILIIIETVDSINNPLTKCMPSDMILHSNLYVGIHMTLINYGTWFWLLYLLISASSYIWALCNSVIRHTNFYTNYPNG